MSSLACPECNSDRLYKDGLRRLGSGEEAQRWLCRDCGYRFTEKKLESAKYLPQENLQRRLNSPDGIIESSQLCAKEAKKLTATETKTVAGEKRKPRYTFVNTKNLDLIPEDARGLLIKFMAYLEREGFAADNQYPTSLSHLVKDGANLLDPENMKSVIAQQKKKNGEPWSDSMKMLAVYAYGAFCTMQGLSWKMPTYHQNEATIYLPDEKELDLLISAASKRMATFLGCLKETFADPSEILRAEWIDLKDNVFSINHPVKGHLSGKYELTPQLTCMLNALPHKNKRIFPTDYKTIYSSLHCLRIKAVDKFQNPALLNITFKSFRHWGGSRIAQLSNGNPLIIMRILRHKSFESSRKYIHTINFKEEDYDETVATTPDEIRALGKAGWQKYDEVTFSGVQMHFYRKPKRFGGMTKY